MDFQEERSQIFLAKQTASFPSRLYKTAKSLKLENDCH